MCVFASTNLCLHACMHRYWCRYKWWKQRLTQLSCYFHAYRIDHILGFFRIWQIPSHGVTGLLGAFNPSNPLPKREIANAGVWDFDRLCSTCCCCCCCSCSVGPSTHL